jgi:hypothetical protein
MPWGGSDIHERGGFYTDFLSESKEKTLSFRGVPAERQQATGGWIDWEIGANRLLISIFLTSRSRRSSSYEELTMPALESLKQSILTECDEDHVGLRSVIRDVEEFLPQRDETAVRNQVLRLLHELLAAHEIKAGFPTREGGPRSLKVAPEKILARIEADWPVGHRPTIGEGLWFTRAKKRNRKSG